jgi:hypothetical protein
VSLLPAGVLNFGRIPKVLHQHPRDNQKVDAVCVEVLLAFLGVPLKVHLLVVCVAASKCPARSASPDSSSASGLRKCAKSFFGS